ncbi:MAG: flagellar hook-basal body complex protein [Desulfovibrionaceae bacterium]
MGLSASMWGSVSGLLMHGEKMNVVGNNIANISTIGFKGQRMDFEDYIYQNSFSAGGPTQIGRGVGISAVMGDFSQSSFETTNDPTDLAIAGKGFFQVKDPYSEQVWYTRAGNFRFDKEGTLRNPQGFALQGWEIDNTTGLSLGTGTAAVAANKSPLRGTGVPTDVRFNTWTVDPKQTSKIEWGVQLDTRPGNDKSVDAKNPMFSLFGTWNGKQPPLTPSTKPISSDAYAYPATMQVYDEGGTAHTITTYFDQVTGGGKIQNLPAGYQVYEYLTTMNPAEDLRTYGGTYNPATGLMQDDLTTYTAPLNAKGNAVPAGHATLATTNPAGMTLTQALALVNANSGLAPITEADLNIKQYPSNGWTLDPTDPTVRAALGRATGADLANLNALVGPPALANLTPADANTVKKMSETQSAGILMTGTLVFNSAGQLVSQSAYSYKGNTVMGDDTSYNFNPDNLENWEPTPVSSNGYPVFTPNFSGQPLANSVHQKASTASLNQNDAERYLIELDFGFKSQILDVPWSNARNAATVGTDYANLASMVDGKRSPTASRASAAQGATITSLQDGYTFGSLSNYNVDKDGILYGIYSNGVTLPLYQTAIYDFVNTQGLRREGGNLFSATQDSGNPRLSAAGQNGMGTVNSYSVEQSNVDMAREFVQMISTQRGFQANSKGITTVDAMLETVIGMKR